jgi:hypothetical protein
MRARETGRGRVDRRSLLAGAACVAALPAAALAQPDLRAAALQAGVERAEAIRAVKRLEHAFAHYCLFGMWAEAADLFARGGAMRGKGPDAVGPPAIRARLREAFGGDGMKPGQLFVPLVMCPVVNLSADGRAAKGRWHETAMRGTFGGRADWLGGIYENDYVLEDGVWKFAVQHWHGRFEGRYETGWRNTANGAQVVPFHYDARGAGVPIPPLPGPPRPAAARLDALVARIDRLNDESLIANLQNAYGYYVDRKMWDDVADLFTDTATMELGNEGAYVGRASIRRGLDRFGLQGLKPNELNDHIQLQLVVTLSPDGNSALARGIDLGTTGLNEQWARWSVGVFENRYVKQAGVWKIDAVRLTPRMACDYALGWGRDAQAPDQPSAAFPPDRPPSNAATPYPAVSVPPFSFAHPVRGPRLIPRPAFAPVALEETERRLRVATAYDGAENVCNAYGYYIDEFAWDETADIFAREGWKELSYVGTYVGRERIRASLKKRYGPGGRTGSGMTLHQKLQPVITVAPDGRSAKVRERLFQMNSAEKAAGSYIGGIYEDSCVLEDGVWKISGMDLDYTWLANYAGGWGQVKPAQNARFAPPESFLRELPPDRPLRGVVFAPYPGVAPMGFHYANPVSGRAPAVRLSSRA